MKSWGKKFYFYENMHKNMHYLEDMNKIMHLFQNMQKYVFILIYAGICKMKLVFLDSGSHETQRYLVSNHVGDCKKNMHLHILGCLKDKSAICVCSPFVPTSFVSLPPWGNVAHVL